MRSSTAHGVGESIDGHQGYEGSYDTIAAGIDLMDIQVPVQKANDAMSGTRRPALTDRRAVYGAASSLQNRAWLRLRQAAAAELAAGQSAPPSCEANPRCRETVQGSAIIAFSFSTCSSGMCLKRARNVKLPTILPSRQ